MHNAADDPTIVRPLDAPNIRRQARFDPLPLLIAQPKQVSAHDPNPLPKTNQDRIVRAEKLMSSDPSPEEQLARFKQRLDDPSRHWKISDSDYSERELWPKYVVAYEDAIALTSTKRAPWYIIPANHKWFRNLAISQIIADTMGEMGLKLPPTHVDMADIRRKFHAAESEAKDHKKHRIKGAKKAK